MLCSCPYISKGKEGEKVDNITTCGGTVPCHDVEEKKKKKMKKTFFSLSYCNGLKSKEIKRSTSTRPKS